MSADEATPNSLGDRSADSTSSPSANPGQTLRRRAEELAGERAGGMPENLEVLSPEVARRTLHELRVHQIELEMQNEELRRAQEELEVSRARYFELFDLAPVGYFTVSERGLILEANLTAATLLGVARSALVKQPFSRFVFREDQDVYYLLRKALLETGAPQACELRMLKSDAATLWVWIETTEARGADGTFLCRVAVSDITRRKLEEAEKAELAAQNRQLQRAEGLGRMAAAIAHHFNNYLTAVMANLELTIDGLPSGTRSAERLTEAWHAASEAAEVSKLMLTYLGQTNVQREPLDLSDACRRSLPLLRAAMPRNVVLDTDLPSPGPAVSANANQIRQVLTNLVTNAWEAGGEGRCAIHLNVKTVSRAEVPASRRFPIDWRPRDQAYACMEVVDAGSGIADKDIEKLFDPFFSSKLTGRGMGLAVVLGIVRSHGGAVTVDSAQGRGSTFRVFLPVLAGKVFVQQEQAAASLELEWSGTVLLVDDEEMVRKVCNAALTTLGFTVLLAKDGVDAVEVFTQHKDEIRCVLCDLTMPRMNGWETLAALRKLAPGIPVILASGYDMAHLMAGDHPEQPQAFLNKPFHLGGLRDAIGRALTHGKNLSGS